MRRYAFLTEFLGLLLVLVLLAVFFGFKTEHFLSTTTFVTIANQIPDTIVVAVGMTFVLLIAGIDLSVGSVLAFSGAVLGACLVNWQWPLPLALAACLAVGIACGAVNGFVTVRWALPSFIVTLGMFEMARGAAYLMTGSRTVWIGSSIGSIYDSTYFGLTLPFYLAILLVVAGQLMLSYSAVGRYMIAIGSREESAHLSGIRVWPIKVGIFVTSGTLAAIASVVQCARLQSANPNGGVGLELQAIAAVVIGGTSLMGGRGSVVGSLLGVLIIAVLENGLAQIGAQEPTKRVVTGLVIVVAVVLDYYRQRLAKASTK